MFLLRTLVAVVFLAVLGFLVRGWLTSTAKDAPGDPAALQISISVDPPGDPRSDTPVQIHFENRSERPITILKPLVGSEKGWNLPFYLLSVTDPLGHEIPVNPSSPPTARPANPANPANPKWPADYVVEIGPGKTYETSIGFFRELPLPGRYKLRFTYTFDPSQPGVLGNAAGMVYPRGLWLGSASSDTLSSDLSAWFAEHSVK